MTRKYQRIQYSITVGHAEWRRARRRGLEPVVTPPTISERTAVQWQRMVALTTSSWNRLTKKQIAIACLVLGTFVGLVVLGWWLVPVQWDASTWTGANFNNLPDSKRQTVLENSAELFSYTLDQGRVKELVTDWPGADADICRLAGSAADDAERLRYEALLYISTGRMCGEE